MFGGSGCVSTTLQDKLLDAVSSDEAPFDSSDDELDVFVAGGLFFMGELPGDAERLFFFMGELPGDAERLCFLSCASVRT